MTKLNDNQIAMQGAVARWVEEAARRPDGPALLRKRASWMEEQIGALATSAAADKQPPSHLVGLTAFDLLAGVGDLNIAADRLEQRMKEQRSE